MRAGWDLTPPLDRKFSAESGSGLGFAYFGPKKRPKWSQEDPQEGPKEVSKFDLELRNGIFDARKRPEKPCQKRAQKNTQKSTLQKPVLASEREAR